MKFRVVESDPAAPQPPGVARGTGRYDLAPGIKLLIAKLTQGQPTTRTSIATIFWLDAAGKETRRFLIELPSGVGIAPIVWGRGGTALWIAQVRSGAKDRLLRPGNGAGAALQMGRGGRLRRCSARGARGAREDTTSARSGRATSQRAGEGRRLRTAGDMLRESSFTIRM